MTPPTWPNPLSPSHLRPNKTEQAIRPYSTRQNVSCLDAVVFPAVEDFISFDMKEFRKVDAVWGQGILRSLGPVSTCVAGGGAGGGGCEGRVGKFR